jgi:hypothetical protein
MDRDLFDITKNDEKDYHLVLKHITVMMTDDVTQNIIDEISKADLPNESSYESYFDSEAKLN